MKQIKIKRHLDFKSKYKDIDSGLNSVEEQLDGNDVSGYIQDFIDGKHCDLKNIKYLIKIMQVFYENGEAYINDTQYDEMIDRYKKFRKEEPVGAKNFIGSKIKIDKIHEFPLLRGTLDKARYIFEKDIPKNEDAESVERFIKKCFEIEPYLKFRVSVKYDGVSAIFTILNGKVISAISRGEDDAGADYLHLFKDVKYKVKGKYGLKTEVVMHKDDYTEYCREKGYNYSNLRSAVVSIITSLDGTDYRNYLTPVPLCLVDDKGNELSVKEFSKFNKKIGFNYHEDEAYSYKDFMKFIQEFIQHVLDIRPNLPYAIDGIVIDILNPKIRKVLGRKNNKNKYQIAYKFPPEVRKTIVRNISFTHGRTGIVTPMVYYDEIDFNGTKHNKSSLSSYKRFKSLDLNRGDEIIVTYNNDVMPYVFKTSDCKKGKGIKFKYDKHCGCGAELQLVGANYMCLNPDCFYKNIQEITYFFKVLGVEDFSEKTIQKLIEENVIKKFTDLFKITYNDLINLEGFADKKINSLLTQLDSLRNKPIHEDEFCHALSVSGEKTCKAIFDTGITIEQMLKNIRHIYGLRIEGIKEKKMNTFTKRFIRKSPVIVDLLKIMNIIPYEKESYKFSVIFTGFRDKNLVSEALSKNIKVEESASFKNIKYLVVADKGSTSSKVEKAKKNNIEIITKEEFKNLLTKI